MAETIKSIVAALVEAAKAHDKPIHFDMKETPLSFDAANVLEKLKNAHVSDGYHRVYEKTAGEVNLTDVLTDRDIEARGYQPSNDAPMLAKGDSPLNRDVLRRHISPKALYPTVWIGERLG